MSTTDTTASKTPPRSLPPEEVQRIAVEFFARIERQMKARNMTFGVIVSGPSSRVFTIDLQDRNEEKTVCRASIKFSSFQGTETGPRVRGGPEAMVSWKDQEWRMDRRVQLKSFQKLSALKLINAILLKVSTYEAQEKQRELMEGTQKDVKERKRTLEKRRAQYMKEVRRRTKARAREMLKDGKERERLAYAALKKGLPKQFVLKRQSEGFSLNMRCKGRGVHLDPEDAEQLAYILRMWVDQVFVPKTGGMGAKNRKYDQKAIEKAQALREEEA